MTGTVLRHPHNSKARGCCMNQLPCFSQLQFSHLQALQSLSLFYFQMQNLPLTSQRSWLEDSFLIPSQISGSYSGISVLPTVPPIATHSSSQSFVCLLYQSSSLICGSHFVSLGGYLRCYLSNGSANQEFWSFFTVLALLSPDISAQLEDKM